MPEEMASKPNSLSCAPALPSSHTHGMVNLFGFKKSILYQSFHFELGGKLTAGTVNDIMAISGAEIVRKEAPSLRKHQKKKT